MVSPLISIIGIPDARMGDGTAGKGCWKTRMLSCNEIDRAANGRDTQHENVQTSKTGLNESEEIETD